MSAFIKIHIFQCSPCLFGHILPCHKISMMLRNGNDDFITFFYIMKAVTVGNQVHRFRTVPGKNDLFPFTGIDEFHHSVTSILISFGRFDGQDMRTAMRVTVMLCHMFNNTVHYNLWNLRSRTAIQIDNAVPIMLFM